MLPGYIVFAEKTVCLFPHRRTSLWLRFTHDWQTSGLARTA